MLPLAYGAARFLVGVRRSWSQRDALLAMQAIVKIAVGIGRTTLPKVSLTYAPSAVGGKLTFSSYRKWPGHAIIPAC
jgi:hypothetical protein